MSESKTQAGGESVVQRQFLEVVDRDEAERRFRNAFAVAPPATEWVPLPECHGRVLAEDVRSPIDVPCFDRSNVDGFAIRASDTYGSSEEEPCVLTLTGEVLATGVQPQFEVRPGFATPIATGAIVPRGADAVVMVEDTHADDASVRVQRSVTPGANITFAGTDMAKGETVLRRGQQLSARETGVLAAVGLSQVPVVMKPRVAILSTGDEIVEPGWEIRPGLVYDSNATVLADTVRELGGEPVFLGIVPDELPRLRQALDQALQCDMVLLSGGTSKGEGDLSYKAVAELGPPGIVVHGVALKPGKPLCLAVVRNKPVAVLPGFPTSAIFTFREFLGPILREMAGLPAEDPKTLTARLPVRVNSARGRTEYTLVSLLQTEKGWTAYPLGKGSGSVTTFSHADGYVTVPRNREYIEADEEVTVRLIAPEVRIADLVVIGSQCLGLDWLLSRLTEKGFSSKFIAVGSSGGVEAVRREECDLAGVHLLDEATGKYNAPFTPPNAHCYAGYLRRQGVVFRRGDPRFASGDLPACMAAALADPHCRMINRNRGSGTRVLIDQLLQSKQPDGYGVEAKSHHAVAAAVSQGRADWGMAIQVVAVQNDLGFLPYKDEQYDFLVPNSRVDRPAVQAFLRLLQSSEAREALATMGLDVVVESAR